MGYTYGTRRSRDLIVSRITEVVKNMELDRMPTRAEVEQYFGNTKLTNAISKRIGWYELAKRLGLNIKESETTMGKSWEANATAKLKSMGYAVRRMPQNFPYDLLVNDRVKIDVKSSRLYRGKEGNFYSFNLEKPFCTCDIYLLYSLLSPGEERVFVVPSKFVATNTQISIGEKSSKYHRFENRWDYISQFDSFMRSVS